MRHQISFILIYMGKLRFAFTNVIFWVVLLLSCFLSENFALFNDNPLKGFSLDSAFILTISIIGLLVLYYFLEHKKNNLKFDKILLPIFIVSGLLLILNVFRQGTIVFNYSYGFEPLVIKFSIQDRIMVSLQIIIWLAVVYALIFVYNRFCLTNERFRWIGKIYLIVILLCIFLDLFIDGHHIISIFRGTYEGGGLSFLMGNENVWSLLIFSGLLTVIMLSYKHFKWYYFALMLFLFTFNLLTTCTATTLIGLVVIIAYTLYEILSRYKENKKVAIRRLIILAAILIGGFAMFRLLSYIRMPVVSSIWSFSKNLLLYKDLFTFSNRAGIWQKVFDVLAQHPLDMIFGLGHKTANKIFLEFTHGLRSGHNGFIEILLRYGLVGVLMYLGLIGLTVYSLLLYIRKKNYRFAFIYGLCFIAILGHSISESTTIFTPNVGGLYFGFVFVLPILNILHEKHFNLLKQELLEVKVSKEKIKKNTVINTIVLLPTCALFAIICARVFALDAFSAIIVLLALLVISLIIISLLRKNKEYNPFNVLSNNLLAYYQDLIRKENCYE